MGLMFVGVGQKLRFLESNCVCGCVRVCDDRLTTVLVAGCFCLVLRLNLLRVMYLLFGLSLALSLCLVLFWG